MGEFKANYEATQSPTYDPDRLTMILHVIDGNRKEYFTVPITDRHGYWRDCYASFLSEDVIRLQHGSRVGPVRAVHVVDLPNAKVYTWVDDWLGIPGVCISPDGKSWLAVCGENYFGDYEWVEAGGKRHLEAVKAKKIEGQLVYINGKMVFPYYDENPPFPTDSPEQYSQRLDAIRAQTQVIGGGYRILTEPTTTMWSPDGRYCALVVAPLPRSGDAASPQDAKLLIMDTLKPAPGRDFRDYTCQIPWTVSAADKSELEARAAAPPVGGQYLESGLKLQFSPSADSILVTDRAATMTLHLQVPLPPDWRDRTIRDSGGIIN